MKEKSFISRLFGGGVPTQEVVQPEIITAPKEVAVAIKPTSKLYTAEDVHRDLTAFVLLFLSDIQQEIERKYGRYRARVKYRGESPNRTFWTQAASYGMLVMKTEMNYSYFRGLPPATNR